MNSTKRTLTLLTLVMAGATAFGQGRILWFNTSVTQVTTNSVPAGPPAGPIAASAGGYYFALFSAPAGIANPSAFSFVGAYGTNTANEGRFFASDAPIAGSTGLNAFSFLVRGWSANIGGDYSAVTSYLANPTFNAWYGESQIGTLVPLQPEGPYPILFGLNPGQIPGFNLNMHIIPEPNALALTSAGLLLLATLARTRRGGSS